MDTFVTAKVYSVQISGLIWMLY